MAPEQDAALLAAILADPDDDAPRLVYADRLLERGDPRGELIDLQCASARLPHAERGGLEHQARQLLQQHRDEWLAPLLPDRRNIDVVFRRGFPYAVRFERQDAVALFLAAAPRLFAAAPVRALSFRAPVFQSFDDGTVDRDPVGDLAALGRSPWLERLESLELDVEPADDLATLAASSRLARLACLNLESCATDEVARALGRVPHLGRLRHLALRSKGVGDEGATALANAASLTALETLWLGGTRIAAGGAAALATRPGLPALRALWLPVAPIGPRGAEAFADSPLTARLRELHLGGCGIGLRGAHALGQSAYAAQVASLLVDWFDIGREDGAKEFGLGPHAFPGLMLQGRNAPYEPDRLGDPFGAAVAGLA